MGIRGAEHRNGSGAFFRTIVSNDPGDDHSCHSRKKELVEAGVFAVLVPMADKGRHIASGRCSVGYIGRPAGF